VHKPSKMPIFEMQLGTGREKFPVYVMTPLCPDLPPDFPVQLPFTHAALFRIEVGRDGSVYTAVEMDTDEAGQIEAAASDTGFQILYKNKVNIPVETIASHAHASFHATGQLNPPGYARGGAGVAHREMTFKLLGQNFGYQHLCTHVISHVGMYRPRTPRDGADAVFDFSGSFLDKSIVPTFEIDVCPFNGDPIPILIECGKRPGPSIGFLTPPAPAIDRNATRRFIRVRYVPVMAEKPSDFPQDHHLIAKVKV